MSSGDLIPRDHDRAELASPEVEFALVISRMIETVTNSPEDMRQTVYDLARYKLQEQFTHVDAKDVKRTLDALETAIRGVEAFSKQHPPIPAPAAQTLLASPDAPVFRELPSSETKPQLRQRRRLDIDSSEVQNSKTKQFAWAHLRRTAAMIIVFIGIALVFQQRDHLASLQSTLLG